MSRKWKLNVKRMAVCAMSASLLLALFPLDAEAKTTKRKVVNYVEDFSKGLLVDYDDGPILFPKDTYSGKKEVTEGPLFAGHTCPTPHSNIGPVDHYEKYGFEFVGDVKDVSIATESSKIITGKEAGANEYETVTYDGKLTAKDKIVRLTYVDRGKITVNYDKCDQGFPYNKYTYHIGTKVNVESLPANAYKIKYNLNGGKVSSKKKLPTKIELTPEDQIVSYEMPTKKGYAFSGWDFYNEAGEQIYPDIYEHSPNTFVVSGLREHANWDRVKATVGGTITAKASWYEKTYSKGDTFSDSVYLKGDTGTYYSQGNAQYKITNAKYGAMKVSCVGSYYYGATGATDIVIDEIVYNGAPFTVTAIDDKAFYNDVSSQIQTITIKSAKITKMGKKAFAGLKKSTVIKVPKKLQKKYTTMLRKSGFKGKIKTI